MNIKSKTNRKLITTDQNDLPNGFLVPIYNIHDEFFEDSNEPQQVYLTVISSRQIKGPHLHKIRIGCFTCIKGNTRFILKVDGEYQIFYSGEDYDYRSVIVPVGVAAALQNLEDRDAYVLNMPNPAWTADMNDEHNEDFSDFDFSSL